MALKIVTTNHINAFVIDCRACKAAFAICHHCYKGHKYCSSTCRHHGYKENLKKANKKYASSVEGKLDHRDRNRVYRQRLKNKQAPLKIPVMDKSSDQSPVPVQNPPSCNCCVVCGRKISNNLGELIENMELQLFNPD